MPLTGDGMSGCSFLWSSPSLASSSSIGGVGVCESHRNARFPAQLLHEVAFVGLSLGHGQVPHPVEWASDPSRHARCRVLVSPHH